MSTHIPEENAAGIGQSFLRLTQRRRLGPSQQSQGLPQPPLEAPYDSAAHIIPLPAPDALDLPDLPLGTAIVRRATLRQYADTPLTIAELSMLLWVTQGIKHIDHERRYTSRTVPSAGARHAFETLLLINRVEGVTAGLYRYLASAHHLLTLSLDDTMADTLTAACLGQRQISKSAVTFFWAAEVERMAWRYGARGYRYLFLDAGHVCQNLYLAAEPIGCGVCAIGAYDDDELNAALNLDGETQFVAYGATVGKRPE